jgi:hypothetical protein
MAHAGPSISRKRWAGGFHHELSEDCRTEGTEVTEEILRASRASISHPALYHCCEEHVGRELLQLLNSFLQPPNKFLENAPGRPKKGKVNLGPAMPRPASSQNMNPDGITSNGSDDPNPNQVDPWIQSQLSTDQVDWLQMQGRVMSQGDLLKNALAEWVVRHPNDWFQGTRLGDAIRFSLTEFIDRHKDEFLAIE